MFGLVWFGLVWNNILYYVCDWFVVVILFGCVDVNVYVGKVVTPACN